MLLKHTGMIHEQKDLPHNFLSVSKLQNLTNNSKNRFFEKNVHMKDNPLFSIMSKGS